MQRPSNRELKAMSAMLADGAAGPVQFKDIGEKTFEGLLKKGWIVPADEDGLYSITEKGEYMHAQEMFFGRYKR